MMKALMNFRAMLAAGAVLSTAANAQSIFLQNEAVCPCTKDGGTCPILMKRLQTAPPPAEKTADGTPVPLKIKAPSGKEMTLRFHDEFDAVTDKDGQPYIDRRKWQTTFWQGSSERTLTGNGEAQYYMDKDYAGQNKVPREQWPNPFAFEKPGVLTIKATKVPQEHWSNWWMGQQRPFASGLLISDRRFVFKYGFVEGRFKLPKNRGAWPAFWLLVNNPAISDEPAKNHPWPPEIDIFEAFGHSPNKFSTNVIPPKTEKVNLTKFQHDMGTDLTQDFHTWAMEWDAKQIVFYFDGKEISRADTSESFRQPMYLMLNLAVGGNWYSQEMTAAKTPFKAWEVDEASMPWKMDVDYVRVYQSPEIISLTGAPAPTIAEAPKPAGPRNAPTPYPDAKDEAAWPGRGPIRVFGWMVDNRNHFWTQREKDKGAVVFVGDSQTAGWKADAMAKEFPGLKIANRGVGGDTSRGVLFRFKEDVLDLQPRALVILIGGNDLSAHGDPAAVASNISMMIEQARAANPKLPIVLCTIAPRDNPQAPTRPGAHADLNARIKKLGEGKENLIVLDLFAPMATPEGKPIEEFFGKDRLHMAAPAYAKWAELLRPAFEKLGVK